MSRSDTKIEAAAQSIRDEGFEAIGIVADVRDHDGVEAAMKATAERWGPIDIVLSGAAGNFLAKPHEMSSNAFKTIVDIDLLGTFNVFRASWPHLRKPGASLTAISAGQAGREIDEDREIIADHRERVVALLGNEAAASPERCLAEAIRGGAKLDRALLMHVLWNMTLAKLAVDQPRYTNGREVNERGKER